MFCSLLPVNLVFSAQVILGNYFNHRILFLKARACPLTAVLEGLLQMLLFLSLHQLADQISGIDTYLMSIIYIEDKFVR